MLSEKMQNELNQRINDELYAWYLYLAVSAHFEAENLAGMAQWMRAQAQEEMGHAMKNFNFLLERGGRVSLRPVREVPDKWDTPLAAFEAAYQHERKVSKIYADFLELARAEKDHATEIFLQWFVTEQVEEEAQTLAIVEKLKLMHNAPGGLFMLDRELGQRK